MKKPTIFLPFIRFHRTPFVPLSPKREILLLLLSARGEAWEELLANEKTTAFLPFMRFHRTPFVPLSPKREILLLLLSARGGWEGLSANEKITTFLPFMRLHRTLFVPLSPKREVLLLLLSGRGGMGGVMTAKEKPPSFFRSYACIELPFSLFLQRGKEFAQDRLRILKPLLYYHHCNPLPHLDFRFLKSRCDFY